MSQIESLLSDYKSGGLEDSAGVFTVDFQAAREKLSKFQLADPHEFLLKFVQAGNLAAKDIEVELSSKSSILLRGWSPDLTLEKLAERLASAGLIVGDDPLTHICVGLSALMGFVPQGVRLCQRVKGAKSAKLLDLGTTLEWKEIESNPRDGSSLKIWWPGVAEISKKTLANLLRERCTYSAVPIALDGEGFEAAIPETSGAHREKFFTTNETLAEHRLLRGTKPFFAYGSCSAECEDNWGLFSRGPFASHCGLGLDRHHLDGESGCDESKEAHGFGCAGDCWCGVRRRCGHGPYGFSVFRERDL